MDDLSFLEQRQDWQCVMCGISLQKACHRRFPILFQKNILTERSYYEKKMRTFVWDRTQERPKLTCSRACGFAYKSWKSTLAPKLSYLLESFVCDGCGKRVDGGRLLKNGMTKNRKETKLCRHCYRKRSIAEWRKAWEEQHREWRNEYTREWRKRQKVAIVV